MLVSWLPTGATLWARQAARGRARWAVSLRLGFPVEVPSSYRKSMGFCPQLPFRNPRPGFFKSRAGSILAPLHWGPALLG